MSKELFNQPLKTEFGTNDRIAIGVPGASGCDNMLVSQFISNILTDSVIVGLFTNDDLEDGTYIINHDKNTQNIRVTLYNPSGYMENLAGILRIIDSNNVALEFGGDIDEGTWRYILDYKI